jgi:hypothetical protein
VVAALSVMLIVQQEPFVLGFQMLPLGEHRILRRARPLHGSCGFEELHIQVAKCVVPFDHGDF